MRKKNEVFVATSAKLEERNEAGIVPLTAEEARMICGGEWNPAPWYLRPDAYTNPFIFCNVPLKCGPR